DYYCQSYDSSSYVLF
nr:immunoglobulin light chain junction region [Macaca mulatta]MOX11316.1 immunoglobulin light chain junction region [Macaca mulatta]MOX11714.1 immunoglobulin light chain junction region [Macaca mulatta]MOX12381.1 immunoglobulin light chain junction region [Macaca mulatta]MOX12728.1 immunoglobulin light chain junction region [Macaca mulatta]